VLDDAHAERRTRRMTRCSDSTNADLVRRIRTLEQELETERQQRGALSYDQQALRRKLLRLETEIILLQAEQSPST
jgi:hypothetical protein